MYDIPEIIKTGYCAMVLKKSLGQHFLKDKNIVKKIVKTGNVTFQDRVIEIGAGGGALTEELLRRRPKTLTVVEIDRGWVEYLKERFDNRVNVIHADATKFDFSSLGGEFKYFGNLPYNVSTAILRNLLKHRRTVEMGIFMVQKEVANRLSAKRGKNYGYLPALLSLFFSVKKLFDVPPTAFTPPPKVMSTVFKMVSKGFDMDEGTLIQFENFLKTAFSHRRKKLKKNLGSKNPPKEIAEQLERRAEELSPQILLKLFKTLTSD